MILVDTNFLVYSVQLDLPEHRACRTLLEGWVAGEVAWYTTWGVIYEFLRVVSHPKILEKPWSVEDATGFVRTLIQGGGLRILQHTEEHMQVLADCLQAHPDVRGSALHDLHIAVLMREHGVRRIVTRDKGFHRYEFVEVVDPLKLARAKS